MQDKRYLLNRYGQAVQFLPPRLRSVAMSIDDEVKANTCEFRLRAGEYMSLLVKDTEITVNTESKIRHEELTSVVDIATGGSLHSSAEQIRGGFITVSNGHRIGVCGSGVWKNGEVGFIKNYSSVAIRISKEFTGVSDHAFSMLTEEGKFENTIIISPPGRGKTTMLRDLIRNLSDSTPGYRVSVVDDRNEIAGKHRGVPQFDLGRHTDIMDSLPKSVASMLLLRAMNPQILAFDEITAIEDVKALQTASNCGVTILATAHGKDEKSLFKRPLYREMQTLGIFQKAVILDIVNGEYTSRVVDL